MIAVDTTARLWEERFTERPGRALCRKNLVTDPDTGVEVRLVRCPAGVINVRHTHPCAHGMYVLDGTLPMLSCILLPTETNLPSAETGISEEKLLLANLGVRVVSLPASAS